MSGEYEVMELRARVLELEGKIEFLYKHLGVTYVRELSAGDSKVMEALTKSGMIEAIKVYREVYKVGLAEAKEAVERIQRGL